MLGLPGSGKSYFASRLADEVGALCLNSDEMRLAIFKSRKETDRIYNSDDRSILNSYTFGALNYAASSALCQGVSVLYDANNNTKIERLDSFNAMHDDAVIPVVVWVKTPLVLAIKRTIEREETRNQRRLTVDLASQYINKINSEIEPPLSDEKLIKIDGTASFEQQYQSFQDQLSLII